MAVIPGGLTKKLQSLDIAVNKPFKDQLPAKWENWMMGGIHEYNKTGQIKRPSYKDIVAWIVESWAAVSENCIRNGFINPLMLNDPYMGRTAPVTSRRCILYIYSTIHVLNILNMLHTLHFFSSKCPLFHNATFFWFLYYSHFKYRVC